MPLTGGVKSGIAVTPAVIFLFANLACLQFGSPFPLRNKHPVKLISVAALADMNTQMHLILALTDLKTVAVLQREQRVYQPYAGINIRHR